MVQKIQTGGGKIEKVQKMKKDSKNRAKNDCHKYKNRKRTNQRDMLPQKHPH